MKCSERNTLQQEEPSPAPPYGCIHIGSIVFKYFIIYKNQAYVYNNDHRSTDNLAISINTLNTFNKLIH